MKQYIRFFRFLFAFLLIPNLYGMQFGEVCRTEKECPQFVEVVKQAMGVKIESSEEAKTLSARAFRTFKDILAKNREGCANILFWNGNAYLNGLFDVTDGFENIDLGVGKKYRAIQLCKILEFSVEEIGTMQDFPDIFSRLDERTLSWFPIESFWNEAKLQTNPLRISAILQNYLKRFKPRFHEHLRHEAAYIEALHTLGINTNSLPLGEAGLFESYDIADQLIRTKMDCFLKKFGDYIESLNPTDGKSFFADIRTFNSLRHLDLPSYLEEANALCSEYRDYTHTEYIVRYQHLKNSSPSEPLYALSFYDTCKNCEEMLAKTTPIEEGKFNTIVISGRSYYDSREKDRNPAQVNKSFLQIQLDPK